MGVIARCEVCEKQIEGMPITDPDEGLDFCAMCAAALLAAQRNELVKQLAGAVYGEQFLADLEHLRCEDDCEGFRDPCAACVVHEALRRLRGQS